MSRDEAVERVEGLQVGEIMIPVEHYPRVNTSSSLADAIRAMRDAQVEVERRRSLPRVLLVYDEGGCLVGTLRRRDIMRGLEPNFLLAKPLSYRKKLFDVAVDPNLAAMSYGRVVREIGEQAHRPVADLMQTIDVTVDVRDHLIKAVYEMVTYERSLLPVLRDGRVVGVLRSVEVFNELVQLVD